MYYSFERCTKREFDHAFAAGERVALVKDPGWAHANDTFVGRGFDRTDVADPYVDGPSRAGEAWYFWRAVAGSATPVGPVEFSVAYSGPCSWKFRCEACDVVQRVEGTIHDRDAALEVRDAHDAAHRPVEVVAVAS